MASITARKDLVISFKKETLLNLVILSKRQPMPTDLSRQLFKDNALEKPTQNVFNHLAYYLVSIIDPKVSAALPWPLYDTKAERAFRNDLSTFLTDCSNKGLLSHVMSSYLVNPGCYKVTLLIFQMSQLAVKNLLMGAARKDSQIKLYTDDMTELYTTKDDTFKDRIETETKSILGKSAKYSHKREVFEKAAKRLRTKIVQMQDALEKSKAQETIDNLADGFLKENRVDEDTKSDILKFKNINEQPVFLENHLTALDIQINDMEKTWDEKMTPFISICQKSMHNTETIIARHMGEADRKSFTIEYNSKSDEICTQELQTLVNSQQKYILKNIIKEEQLDFPNLIRGYLISVCHIMKDTKVARVDMFNEYLNGACTNYEEFVATMRSVLERVMKAESRLSPPKKYKVPDSYWEMAYRLIPPMPDLSKIKLNRDPPILSYDFTPLNLPKREFNFGRGNITIDFAKPFPKMPLLNTPFHELHHSTQRDDFLKTTSSVSLFDQNTSLNLHNISSISNISKLNETIAKNNVGFTKEQIFRLLSTKSSKKFAHKTVRPSKHVVKGGLFNECSLSNDRSLYRSHSSPNLHNAKDMCSMAKTKARKLSIMKEGSPSLLEVSGIRALDRDSKNSTPCIPTITITGSDTYRDKPKPTALIDCESADTKTSSSIVNIPADSCHVENVIHMDTQKTSVKLQMKTKQQSHIPRRTANSMTESKISEIFYTPKDMDYLKPGNMDEFNAFKSTDDLQVSDKSPQKSTDSQVLYTIENTGIERKSTDLQRTGTDTPTTKSHLIKKTSSIEKIINRFKKIRASVVPDFTDNLELLQDANTNEFKTIAEEKDNISFNPVNVDVRTANRVLLPDLLSPSCSTLSGKLVDLNLLGFDEEETESRKPRESLGTMLGVDSTILDDSNYFID